MLQTRRYYLQNWRADVMSLVGTDGNFPGWYKYSAYGQFQPIAICDVSGTSGFRDGGVDSNDFAFNDWFENGDVRADLNGDGGVDINDTLLFLASFEAGGACRGPYFPSLLVELL